MKFEGGSRQEVIKKPHEDFDDGFDLDSYPPDEVSDSSVVEGSDAEELDIQETEHQQAIVDRLEARAFSKEHSQFYRDRLARRIWQRRGELRRFLDKQDKDISNLEESRDGTLNYLNNQIGRHEEEKLERQRYIEEFESLKKEVSELESEIEDIKNSFWKRFIYRDKLAILESKRREMNSKQDQMYEPDRARFQALDQQISEMRLRLEEEEKSVRTDNRIAEIRQHSFFVQDNYVTGSKKLIKEFYQGNLELSRESEEDSMARDVAENCRELGVLLRHGVPVPNPQAIDVFTLGATENNKVIDSATLNPSERVQLAVSLQPAISTHTGWGWSQGLLVGGGEITSAGESDLFTHADGLDSRNPKYEEGQVSSLMPDIKQRFKDAVENQGKPGNKRPHNEIVVKHPKFSAVYTVDSEGKYGTYNEFDGRNLFDTPETRWALEQSVITGLPAVVILESGKMINIATDEEVTMEELLVRPVEHSVEERLSMFSGTVEKNVTETGVVAGEELSERLEYFDAVHEEDQPMEQYKQVNRELAEAKLLALEYEREEARRKIKEKYGL
ncbi:MAG: hypothetical protein RLZZ480_483 [Candidatus Parcubacteria bacterium]|jgi:hypothetical protein